MAPRSSDVWWKHETNQLQRSFAGLKQIYFDMTTTSMRFSALVSSPAHLVWLKVEKRRRKYLAHYRYTLLGLLPIRIAELEVNDGKLEVDESIPLSEFASSDVVALEESTVHTPWTGAQKERTKMLGKAISFLLKPLKWIAESGFQILPGSKDTRKCFPMIVLYCCEISEAMDMSAVRHGSRIRPFCAKCHSRHETMVMGRESSGLVVAETTKMRRTVEKVAEERWKPGGEGP